MEGPLGEYRVITPATLKPVARITAITHRNKPYFQGLLTRPVTENILKQIPFEASFLKALKRQFPRSAAYRCGLPPACRSTW
jgi:4-hydroxy-3-polyprenylbenzoate decarboxylase/2,5-furandicarboxylate decarboxylase 1